MAADVSLPLQRIVAALQAFFAMLSDPDTLPEFRAIQVRCTRGHVPACMHRQVGCRQRSIRLVRLPLLQLTSLDACSGSACLPW